MIARVAPRKATLTVGGETVRLAAPGLKVMRRANGSADLYWVASEEAKRRGYPTKTRRIHLDLSVVSAAAEIERICQIEQAQMLAWLDEPGEVSRTSLKFDGTLGSLVRQYEADPDSSYRDLKANTAVAYGDSLKILLDTVGARRLDRLAAKDFRRWYRNWKQPSEVSGKERIRRAYGCIQVLRIVLSYGVEAGNPDCRRLRRDMESMRFAKNPPRTEVLSFSYVESFVDEALRQGNFGMATATALQFECFLRQGDVVGSWRDVKADYVVRDGEVRVGDRVWSGLTWDQLDLGKDLRITTSKTRQPVIHAIGACQLVVRCLTKSGRPADGPVAARADGSPFRDRQAFGKAWRIIATTAGVPKSVWNMDARAGGISEAAEAGVADDDIARSAAHASKTTTQRIYKRLGHETSRRVSDLRAQHRQRSDDDEKEGT